MAEKKARKKKASKPAKKKPRVPNRTLIIAGDDGNLYQISEAELAAKYPMDRDTKNYRMAALFADLGVFHMRFKKAPPYDPDGQERPEHHQFGIAVWLASHQVHFVNLSVSHDHEYDGGGDDCEDGDDE